MAKIVAIVPFTERFVPLRRGSRKSGFQGHCGRPGSAAMGDTASVRVAPRNAHRGSVGGEHRVAYRESGLGRDGAFSRSRSEAPPLTPVLSAAPRPAAAPAPRAAVLARCGSRRQLRAYLTGLGGKSQNLPYSVFGACRIAFSDRYRHFSPHSHSAVKKNGARGMHSSRCLTLRGGKRTPGCDPRSAGR